MARLCIVEAEGKYVVTVQVRLTTYALLPVAVRNVCTIFQCCNVNCAASR